MHKLYGLTFSLYKIRSASDTFLRLLYASIMLAHKLDLDIIPKQLREINSKMWFQVTTSLQ